MGLSIITTPNSIRRRYQKYQTEVGLKDEEERGYLKSCSLVFLS